MADKNDPSRRDALKKIGAAVGSTLIAPSLWAQSSGAAPRRLASAAAGANSGARKGGKPNILWITLEGVPISVLSCYGSRLIETPNIDRIAREGMRFENAFCTNPLCSPSRATLLTGKYAHLNGMIMNPPYHPGESQPRPTGAQPPVHFDLSQETFPRIMQQHGYQTGISGKWHLLGNPAKAGFDAFAIKRGTGSDSYNPKGYLQNPSIGSKMIEEKSYPGYVTDTFTDIAIQDMKRFKQPFLMMFQPFNDHRPFDPPKKYAHLYDNVRIPEPSTFWDDYSKRTAAARYARMRVEYMPDYNPPKDLTGRQRKQWNYQKFLGHFLATLRDLDDNVGRLLHYLDENGLSDNTIVVLTSDHGFFLGEHGWLDKRLMYEESIRVPWMIRWPGQVKAGSTTKDWTINIDNAPTALDLAGLPIPSDMQGKSVKPVVQGNTPSDWKRTLYCHYYEFGEPHWAFPYYGVRTDRYKLINYYRENEWELFDLEKDPDEMENLFQWAGYKIHEGYGHTAKNLVVQLKQLRHKYKDNTGWPVKLWPTSSYD
jgi:arylsulfatase A-like enzyme